MRLLAIALLLTGCAAFQRWDAEYARKERESHDYPCKAPCERELGGNPMYSRSRDWCQCWRPCSLVDACIGQHTHEYARFPLMPAAPKWMASTAALEAEEREAAKP